MRARMAIMISQTPVRLREVLLRDKPGEMLAISAKGTVPVLVDGNLTVDESLEIMRWALAINDPENWLKSAMEPLVQECDGDFKHHLDRYKYASRYDQSEAIAHRDAGFAFLQKLDMRLGDTAFLAGDTRSFVDMAIFPFVRQFRIADARWFDSASISHVQQWLSGLLDSALFNGVMQKYPVWKDTGEEITFPAAPTL